MRLSPCYMPQQRIIIPTVGDFHHSDEKQCDENVKVVMQMALCCVHCFQCGSVDHSGELSECE